MSLQTEYDEALDLLAPRDRLLFACLVLGALVGGAPIDGIPPTPASVVRTMLRYARLYRRGSRGNAEALERAVASVRETTLEEFNRG